MGEQAPPCFGWGEWRRFACGRLMLTDRGDLSTTYDGAAAWVPFTPDAECLPGCDDRLTHVKAVQELGNFPQLKGCSGHPPESGQVVETGRQRDQRMVRVRGLEAHEDFRSGSGPGGGAPRSGSAPHEVAMVRTHRRPAAAGARQHGTSVSPVPCWRGPIQRCCGPTTTNRSGCCSPGPPARSPTTSAHSRSDCPRTTSPADR